MNIFKLTRTDMVRLLYTLKVQREKSPLDIVVQSANMTANKAANHLEIPEFLSRYERKKLKKEYGLYTYEIVELGNL
ncbi:hypothetical protein MMJ63_28455, partial [Bacillus vallismortis]|nr:hypothetical protein [Bacillus vallismortis]